MILVTGAKGQLGSDVCRILSANNEQYLSVGKNELDITDENAVNGIFERYNFSAVIHCAAYTAVDKAEDNEEDCFKVNYAGTENIAKNCCKYNAKLLYVSTDYVFGGDGDEPYETNSKKSPLNIYAKSKLKGEEAVSNICSKYFIVRTSWVFGEKNTNFIYTMLKLSETHDSVCVVCDQIGSPTYSRDLAELLYKIIKSEKYGVYHATNSGFCSWAQLAQEVFKISEKNTTVHYVSTQDYGSKAKRPLNSRLSKKSLTDAGFSELQNWQDAVKEYISNI